MAGVTIVIVKDDELGKAPREIPTMLNYQTHVERALCSILLLLFLFIQLLKPPLD